MIKRLLLFARSSVTERLCQCLILQDYEDINKGVVNSLLYKHQAEHFTNTQNIGPAIKCLKIGRAPDLAETG